MLHTEHASARLFICTTCRDGWEGSFGGARGGMRLAEAVLENLSSVQLPPFEMLGVECISQCKRPCAVGLAGLGRFSYLFGDLDPSSPDHVDALLTVLSLYLMAPEGFIRREERPPPLRKGILGRLPPSQDTLMVSVTSLSPGRRPDHARGAPQTGGQNI